MDGRQLMAFQPFNQAGPIHFIYLNGELKHTVNSLMELRRGGSVEANNAHEAESRADASSSFNGAS